MPTYEIYRREANQHRTGHFGLLIDGIEAELTVDPHQFLPKSIRQAIAEGLADPGQQTLRAAEICEDYARAALERRIEKLVAGSLLPGGVPLDATGGLDTRRVPRRGRTGEKIAVEAFLNRGHLSGLSKTQRLERSKRHAQKNDCEAEWRKNRAALIALREEQLDEAKKVGGPKAERVIKALEEELARLKSPILCASHGFQYAYTQYLTGAVDLVNDDIRIWPLMTNTTADTERDAKDMFSDFTTTDEFDGSGYSSGGLALDSQAVAVDDANDRAEFDAADEVVSALGAGTRSIQGIVLGKFSTNTAGSMPLHWIEFASNKTPDGSDFTFVFNAEGILQAADG